MWFTKPKKVDAFVAEMDIEPVHYCEGPDG